MCPSSAPLSATTTRNTKGCDALLPASDSRKSPSPPVRKMRSPFSICMFFLLRPSRRRSSWRHLRRCHPIVNHSHADAITTSPVSFSGVNPDVLSSPRTTAHPDVVSSPSSGKGLPHEAQGLRGTQQNSQGPCRSSDSDSSVYNLHWLGKKFVVKLSLDDAKKRTKALKTAV